MSQKFPVIWKKFYKNILGILDLTDIRTIILGEPLNEIDYIIITVNIEVFLILKTDLRYGSHSSIIWSFLGSRDNSGEKIAKD